MCPLWYKAAVFMLSLGKKKQTRQVNKTSGQYLIFRESFESPIKD